MLKFDIKRIDVRFGSIADVPIVHGTKSASLSLPLSKNEMRWTRPGGKLIIKRGPGGRRGGFIITSLWKV